MILAFILWIICFDVRMEKGGGSKDSFISAIISWNICSFIIVELLSLWNSLTLNGLLFMWGGLNIALLFFIGVNIFRKREIEINIHKKKVLDIGIFLWNHKLISLAGIAVLLLAMVTIPYTPDSLAYHIPRIAHWAQNRSVAHYATNDIRQISSPVLAEFINVQVYILSGKSDRLLNLLQSFSYLTNSWLVYKIAVKIGCKKQFASLAVLLFMTMPIAFGEALTTQVDLFATVWLLIFIYYYIDVYEAEHITMGRNILRACISMGGCVSLGYLAKPSVNVGMAVLFLLLLAKCIKRKDRLIDLGKLVICVLPVVILPLLPELIRNFHTFAAFSDVSAGEKQLVGTIRPHYLLINLLKNFAQNFPNIYLYDSAEWIAKIVMMISRALKVDINDADIAENGMAYMIKEAPVYDQDMALNPVVVILASLCFIFCLVQIRNHKDIGNRYSVWTMVMFIIFCGVVRWESFVTRYMLSYLAALCPMIGWQVQVFTETDKREKLRIAIVPVIYFLCFTELFSLCRYHQELWHEDASLKPEHFFLCNKDSRTEYIEMLEWINDKELKEIGVKCGSSNFEYVIWYMLRRQEPRIEHILVENDSVKYMSTDYIPDCIVGDVYMGGDEGIVTVNGISYQRVAQFEENKYITVYIPQ